jgi:hypothetical protein
MATCTVDSVCAWQHPFHERAARISQSTLRDDYMINWNGVFMGTKDPDRKREDCPWINQSHKRDHWRINPSSWFSFRIWGKCTIFRKTGGMILMSYA